jgi:phosphoglycolate phosphatase-like HAD superfamily hydrolase
MDGTLTPPGLLPFSFLRTSIIQVAKSDANFHSLDLESDVLSLIPNMSPQGQAECKAILKQIEDEIIDKMSLAVGVTDFISACVSHPRAIRMAVVTRNVDDAVVRLKDLVTKALPPAADATLPDAQGQPFVLHPMITRESGLKSKPAPDAIQHILRSWDMHADDVVMIGDSLFDDVGAAVNAGTRSVFINTGINNFTGKHLGEMDPSDLKPTWEVKEFREIRELLEQNFAAF